MTTTELKNKMMKLWKDTFHDSDSYISLIFEEYFNIDYVEYHEENGQLVSALIGIPYEFGCAGNTIKGLYLCGLATKEEYRHKGIMNGLINRINDKARAKGIVLSFLIPASDMLRIYYQGKGYVNGMYRVEERYTDIHDFHKDCILTINREEDRIRTHRLKIFENLSVKSIDGNDEIFNSKIAQYIYSKERNNSTYISLLHTLKDIEITIKENMISGGEIIVALSSENEINGVAYLTFDERRRIVIPKIYYDDQCSYYKLLDKAKKMHIESPMSVWRYPEETDRHALWSKIYGAGNPDGGMLGGAYGIAERVYDVSMHALPYGMVKILNYTEILKFLAEYRNDVKFSILIKEATNSQNGVLYKIEYGKLSQTNVKDSEADTKRMLSHNITVLTTQDMSELLFRKKDGNSLIMEAFGIPRLAINMSLLLD